MATLKQLTTFIAVAEYKKMSEAAKKLFISQPTVSQIISDLETEYHAQFFERYPKELQITPMGSLFLEHAQEVVASYDNLNQFMKTSHTVRPLRVGATLTIGNTMLSPLVEYLQKEFPDIDINAFVDNTRMIEHRLIHNELDIALVEGVIVRDNIVTEPIIQDELVLFCNPKHPFAHRDYITLKDLHGQNFVMREKGSGTRAIFENILTNDHVPYKVKWECNSGTAIIDAVRHNQGLAVLSRRCVEPFEEAGEVCFCNLRDASLHRFFYLCYNKAHPVTSQMKDFIHIAKLMP